MYNSSYCPCSDCKAAPRRTWLSSSGNYRRPAERVQASSGGRLNYSNAALDSMVRIMGWGQGRAPLIEDANTARVESGDMADVQVSFLDR
jgi:hypothetical protein